MRHLLSSIIFTVLCCLKIANGKVCKALTMSGAGTKGAYQAAVIKGLTDHLPKNQIDYDVLVGVSAGSINALMMSSASKEHADQAGQIAMTYWNESVSGAGMPDWPGDVYEGLFLRSGLHPNDPSIEKMSKRWEDKTLSRKVSFSTVDSINAKYKVYDFEPSNELPDNLIETCYASTSIPFIYTNRKIDGKVLIDGGVVWNINIDTAVRRCLEVVDSHKDIIIDVVHVGNDNVRQESDLANFKTLDHLYRSMEISSFQKDGMNNYNASMDSYPDVNFRYIISPSEDLSTGGIVSLDFTQEFIDKCFEVGLKDAESAVKQSKQDLQSHPKESIDEHLKISE